jgi:hypothetical protein
MYRKKKFMSAFYVKVVNGQPMAQYIEWALRGENEQMKSSREVRKKVLSSPLHKNQSLE